MKERFDNSVYHKKNLLGKTVMFIIPHEDDEINAFGGILPYLAANSKRVICVFTTNGDYTYDAKTRMYEAMKSLKLMGVSAENVYFLGYGDCYRDPCNLYLNPHSLTGVRSSAGHEETYGLPEKPDYRYLKSGRHSCYTLENFLLDLRDIILDFEPETLFTVGMDAHPDHVQCSLMTDAALQLILSREGNTYQPRFLKGFAYETDFQGTKDFYARNLLATTVRHAVKRSTATSNPTYCWEDRLRFPIDRQCFSRFIFKNLLYKALACHHSQVAICAADSDINSDQIFWEQRTNAISYQGRYAASSGNAAAAGDFQLYAVRDIRADILEYCDQEQHTWIPDEEDEEKCLQCFLPGKRDICEVVLYGNIEGHSAVLEGVLQFSNGDTLAVGELQKSGRATRIVFPTKLEIEWVSFSLTRSRGKRAGLTAFELYEPQHNEASNPGFIKLMTEDNFLYDYVLQPETERLELALYSYGVREKTEIELREKRGGCSLQGKLLQLDRDFRQVTLYAHPAGREDIYDIVLLRRPSAFAIHRLHWLQQAERFCYRSLRRLLLYQNSLMTKLQGRKTT